MDAMQPSPSGLDFGPGGRATLLHKVMESAAVGMVLLSLDQTLVYANPAFCDMLGYDRVAALSLDVSDVVIADQNEALGYLRRLVAGDAADFRGEVQLRCAKGDAIWVMASASVLRTDDGQPLYVILQFTNIDRQKKAEEALIHTESRWSAALEAAKQGVWEHDSRTDTMYYSPMWRQMRGFTRDEPIDDSQDAWLSRLHPDDRERIRNVVHHQDSGDDGFDTLEYRELHRAGHYIWILSRGRPVEWDAEGRPVRTLGTDTDITTMKVIEQALAEEKQRLRVTLESIADGVISTDALCRVTFMNRVAEKMTGWSPSDAVGCRLSDVFRIVDHTTGEAAIDPVAVSLDTGRPCYLEEEVSLIGRDGEPRDIRASAAPVRTPEGRTIGAVLAFQDITHSRTLQKELTHSASHDFLTGLPNRGAFDRALAAAVTSSHAEDRTHALCYVDLDRFKPVNDGAGHAAGDALLQQVAETIRHNCRASDFAARIGGDEFAILLSDCLQPHARAVATKLVEAIRRIAFPWNGDTYRIGASIGIVMIAKGGPSAAALADAADVACYEAKRAGRGRVVVYSERLGRKVGEAVEPVQ